MELDAKPWPFVRIQLAVLNRGTVLAAAPFGPGTVFHHDRTGITSKGIHEGRRRSRPREVGNNARVLSHARDILQTRFGRPQSRFLPTPSCLVGNAPAICSGVHVDTTFYLALSGPVAFNSESRIATASIDSVMET